jgi:hypothetical protein
LKFLDNGAGVRYRYWGRVTGDDFIKANEELFSSQERFNRIRYSLIEPGQMEAIDVSASELFRIVGQDSRASAVNPDIVIAVCADTDLAFGISRLWELMCRTLPWEIMVFRAKADAYAWTRERVKTRFGIDVDFA